MPSGKSQRLFDVGKKGACYADYANVLNIEGRVRFVRLSKEFIFSVAAPFGIIAASFTKFILERGYGLFHLEVGIVFAWMFLAALAMGILTVIAPRILRPVFVSVLVFLFLYVEISKSDLHIFDLLGGGAEGKLAIFLFGAFVFFATIMAAYWKLQDEFFVLATAVFSAIVAVVLVWPGVSKQGWEFHRVGAIAPNRTLPPVVHIVLDGQIGVDGLPTDLEAGRQLRNDLLEFYMSRGFTVFKRAYSHFALTLESMGGLLNNEVHPNAYKVLDFSKNRVAFTRNAWFERLARRGYRIDVYQSRYLDYCGVYGTGGPLVHSCASYDPSDLRLFQNLDTTSAQKARLILKHYLDVDVVPPLMPALFVYHWLKDSGWPLPGLGAYRSVSPSSIAAYEAMSRLSGRMESLKRGEAIFAHILLPHAPFVFGPDCAVEKRASQWRGRSNILWAFGIMNTAGVRARRYRSYISQSRCTHLKLAEILDKVTARQDLSDATIIIHGDHGSKIVQQEPYALHRNEVSGRDIVDSYSTLFAIRKPGLAAGQVLNQHSIQRLFGELVMGHRAIGIHGNVYLQPNTGVVGPNQVPVKMVPIRPWGSATGKSPPVTQQVPSVTASP